MYSAIRNVSYFVWVFPLSFSCRVRGRDSKGTDSCTFLIRDCGYPLSLNIWYILSCILLYSVLQEQALRSLVNSPLTTPLNMFLGWAEEYSKYLSF